MQTKPPRTVNEWITELNSADPQRREQALATLAVLAPSSGRAAAALRAAGVTDLRALTTATGRDAAPDDRRERAQARRLYWVSLLLPLAALSLICLGPMAFVYPLLLLVLVVMSLRSPAPFVFWHTCQWLLLTVACALLLAVPFISVGRDSFPVGAILLLGGLWYGGNIVGLVQAGAGHCWSWKFLEPGAELPRPWARPAIAGYSPPAPAVSPAPPPRTAAGWLHQFRSGTAEERQAALAQLEALGEVEVF